MSFRTEGLVPMKSGRVGWAMVVPSSSRMNTYHWPSTLAGSV